jgi:NAD(P)-dependent dehydrogenase (short-subunit alcohol dehydrogenase family)
LDGKTVIVTGSNTGIGKETARDMARRGAKVILGCRNQRKAQEVANEIMRHTNNKSVLVLPLDLTSFKSVRAFADSIVKNEERLDILINNAGMIGTDDKQVTEDGLELQFQTNHLGPFLLTNLLLPKLKANQPSRVVMVASEAHRFAKTIPFDNLKAEKFYKPRKIYAMTKACNILFTHEMAKRLEGSGVTINCLHPGVIATELYRNFKGVVKLVFGTFEFLLNPFWKSAEEGAQTTIFAAVDESLDTVSGKYFSDCRLKTPTALVTDDAVAKKLWEVSESLTKL